MENMFARASANLIDRIGGPMTFRLFLQPTVAAYFAIRGGLRVARERRRPHGWVILTDSTKRRELLCESLEDVAKIFSRRGHYRLNLPSHRIPLVSSRGSACCCYSFGATALFAAKGSDEPNRSALAFRPAVQLAWA